MPLTCVVLSEYAVFITSRKSVQIHFPKYLQRRVSTCKMARFGDGLRSSSNLKGQLKNYTEDVLTECIVEEIDARSKALIEANEKCVELQELLNSKDAEILLLRRHNCELQKTVTVLNEKPKDSNDTHQDDNGEVFFWDPLSSKNRNSRNQNHERQLQEQLAQATMKIRDLETELKCFQKDEPTEGHRKVEFLRAKQDMVNRIIQMEEKNQEAERNTKRMQLDEMALINDFRTVLSKLNSLEKLDLVRNALRALETENGKYGDLHKRHDGFIEASNNRESELYKKIEELQEENKRLFSSVEQLDQQHEESIEKLLSLKEEIEKKHQCLQNAYEQLYVDYNQAQDKVVQLEDRLTNAVNCVQVETVSLPVQTARVETEDRLVQTDVPETNEEKNDKTDIDELTVRVQNILKNTFVETEPGVSIFEAVAKQYVDAKWKRDVLEKTVMELNRKLKEAVEVKDHLQDTCYNMQIHNDSLVLEVQDLKLNLPSIPEASEERVAWLESETESLREQVRSVQKKNAMLRREKLKQKGSGMNEIRLENQGHAGTASKNRKLSSLEDIPEDREIESLNNSLHTTLDENDELRKKIGVLENTGKETEEQLKMSLEKCRGLDDNIEFIEELKLELENVKRELKTSIFNKKQLENNLALLQGTKDGVQKENEELYQIIKQLEMGASKWSEINLERENNALQELQEQLGRVSREKDDLEYDILNMRKELDEAFNQIDTKESHITKLTQDNENLMKEKNLLLEQLTATQDESNDKIDLVNTEKSLLEQEQIELKEIEANKEKELNELKEQLRESEGRYTKLENEFSSVNVKAEQLRLQNENLQNEVIKQEELKNELDRTKSTIERLNSIENDYSKLVKEVETLREKEKALIALQEHFTKLMEENKNLVSLNESIQDKLVQTQNRELVSHPNENNCDNEKQQIIDLLEEKTRENDALKIDNDKLMAEIIESQKKLQNIIESNKESTDMAKQTIESLSHLVSKKDEEINGLKATLDLAKNNAEMLENFATIKNERDELVKLVTVKHNESLQYHGEIQRLTHLLAEQASKIQNLVSEKEKDLSQLTETNAELLWAKNELRVAQQRLKHTENSITSETCGIVEHSKQIAEIALLNEKCNALEASLIQEQSNNRMLHHQFSESQNKEANAAKELERLRTHLVEIESTYTEEALIAEETRKELEAKLLQAEEKVKSSSTAYTSANIRANQQVETLQQQITLIIQQRDEIQNKLSTAEDTILSQAASLTNLQFVLEQFQRDKERDIKAAMERLQAKLNDSYKKQEELVNDVTNLKEQLAEAKECLQAASRLSEQLDKKTERIEQLNQEVDRLTNLVNTADHRKEEAKQSEEGQIDKTLVKNLFVSYLLSSAADKSSVLRVFSTILEFSDAEKEKVGLSNATTPNSWFSRLSSGPTVVNKDQDTSLSAAFVRFLESESKSKPQLPALPIQTSSLPRPGHSRQHSTSSTQSTLLLSNINLPTFPDFVPARNTGSILKEVLKDS